MKIESFEWYITENRIRIQTTQNKNSYIIIDIFVSVDYDISSIESYLYINKDLLDLDDDDDIQGENKKEYIFDYDPDNLELDSFIENILQDKDYKKCFSV